jgi:hypothetical protein
VFVLSFRQRDEVAAAAAGGGWRVVAARRPEGLEQRFLASGANVAVIDARGAMSDGLDATKALGPVIEAHGGAMLILVSQSDTVHMRAFYDAGATHFLGSPMSSRRWRTRFASPSAMSSGWRGRAGRGLGNAEPLGWRYDPEMRSLQVTPAWRTAGPERSAGVALACMRRLDPGDRSLVAPR